MSPDNCPIPDSIDRITRGTAVGEARRAWSRPIGLVTLKALIAVLLVLGIARCNDATAGSEVSDPNADIAGYASLRSAADDGDAWAMYLLGMLHFVTAEHPTIINRHVPYAFFVSARSEMLHADQPPSWCPEEAAELWHAATDASSDSFHGKRSEAERWLRAAIERDHGRAATALGDMCIVSSEGEEDAKAAANWYREAAKLGDDQARQCRLGWCHWSGLGVTQDTTKGRRLLEAGVDSGDSNAMVCLSQVYWSSNDWRPNESDAKTAFGLAKMSADTRNPAGMDQLALYYAYGVGTDRDPAQAARWFEKAGVLGHREALKSFAFANSRGLGIPQDGLAAVRLLQESLRLGYVRAAFEMGHVYEHGLGIPQDLDEAIRWYRMGSEAGEPGASNALGLMVKDGRGTPVDEPEAIRLFQHAIDHGITEAMCNLALLHRGSGEFQDIDKAVRLYREAAALGIALAMFELGYAHEVGDIVEQDDVKARTWYRKAADRGFIDAMVNLAVLHYFGRGGPQDIGEAIRLSRQAADLGDDVAMFNLGWVFEDLGRIDEAVQWYRAAANAGNRDASERLDELRWAATGYPSGASQQPSRCIACAGSGVVPRRGTVTASQTAGMPSGQMRCSSCNGTGRR